MFEIGEKIVYPGHGVGEITGCISREIGGVTQQFLKISLFDEKLTTCMIPSTRTEAVGLRRLLSPDSVADVYMILSEPYEAAVCTNWNKRFREYSERVKTGSLYEIASVLRHLCTIREKKGLSFLEKKLFDAARAMLVTELSVIESRSQEEVSSNVDDLLQ